MNTFQLFLELGFKHITDFQGFDHMLFLLALCGVYDLRQWLKVFWVVTFFTISHSLTLALVVFEFVQVNSGWVEFLIPVTILLTGLLNLLIYDRADHFKIKLTISALFGLIHGMGFSGFYKMVMPADQPWVNSYLPFNLGIEIGQLLIVLAVLLISFIFRDFLNVSRKSWNIFISGAVTSLSIVMIADKWPL